MADEKTPKPRIELEEKDERPEQGGAPQAAPEGTGAGDAVRTGANCVSAWVKRTFPGHEKAFWGGVIGLVAAVVFFAIGPWRTLVIAVLVVAGVAVGQVLDGDPKIVNTLRHIFIRNNQ